MSKSKLQERVIEGGYCIGCGGCTAINGSPATITLTPSGKYQAKVDVDKTTIDIERELLNVCPFSGESKNEDELGKQLFSSDCEHDKQLGYWKKNYIGHVSIGSYRSNGSSGGVVSWLLSELLNQGKIDGVIHVVPNEHPNESGVFFNYGISTRVDDVNAGAKSRYYGVELSKVLDYVKHHEGRYLVVGVPCFIKTIRLLSEQNQVFKERIKYTVAILCGHLKSIGYLEFIAWQMGVQQDQIKAFDFRHKMPGNPAKNYAAEIVYDDGEALKKKASLMSSFKGEDWGMGLFKYAACDYCDDVMGETADISVGDAWIEPYSSDAKGTNVVVVRNKSIYDIIESARASAKLHFKEVTPEIASQTQTASFRHRHDGLSYRLWLKHKKGEWAPIKRVKPSDKHLTRKYKKIFKLREDLVQLSEQACLEARSKKDFSLYWPKMRKMVKSYHRCYHPLWIALPRKAWRTLIKLLSYESSSSQ